MTIALNKPYEPDISKLTKYLLEVNKSGWYTNFGPLHQQLTVRLEEFLGVKNLLLVSNGTLAIQVACKVLGISKAITTPFSFVATSSSLLWQGIDIDYVDINGKTLNLCPNNVKEKIANDNSYNGVVATHVYGNPCDVEHFESIQDDTNVKIVYDAAHAFGVRCHDRSVLSFGDASTLSFHATKVFHTVEGGAIVFKNRADYIKAKQLINFGILDNGQLGEPGINAKLNEYQCAVGLTILDDIETILDKRAALLSRYLELVKDVLCVPEWHKFATCNGAYMPVLFSSEESKLIVKSELNNKGIQCREYFSPSLDKFYGKGEKTKVSRDVSNRVLCLPLHYYMSDRDVFTVVEVIKKVYRKL
ncbi:polysaccharide biosynthesis protein [Shewanella algae]|uniref:DegT/DnrJ/EryC1/StrS family aminotransferase n=1 Tax=Shewanella algae TaxID=38313 RepID=UPI001BF0575C|nr:DegT/DnrJ/EryC1/StrS family aminotransferase [Shewanella algae]BCV57502.1 polysaccharide biosynthesis protein [Shewanella algae]